MVNTLEAEDLRVKQIQEALHILLWHRREAAGMRPLAVFVILGPARTGDSPDMSARHSGGGSINELLQS